MGNKRLSLPKSILIPAGVILTEASCKVEGCRVWYHLTIGIGADHTAELVIDDEAMEALKKIHPEVTIS